MKKLLPYLFLLFYFSVKIIRYNILVQCFTLLFLLKKFETLTLYEEFISVIISLTT